MRWDALAARFLVRFLAVPVRGAYQPKFSWLTFGVSKRQKTVGWRRRGSMRRVGQVPYGQCTYSQVTGPSMGALHAVLFKMCE